MKNIIFILLIFFTAGCSRKIVAPPPTVVTVTKDSIITNTVVRDSIITIPGERVVLIEKVPCPDIIDFEKKEKNGNVTVKVTIKKGVLTADCKTDSLQKIIQGLNSQITTLKTSVVTVTHTNYVKVPKRYIPKWVWFLVAFNLGYLAFKFRNPLLTLIGK
jgi:hypothetical protein